jgi:hypothetical protein
MPGYRIIVYQPGYLELVDVDPDFAKVPLLQSILVCTVQVLKSKVVGFITG